MNHRPFEDWLLDDQPLNPAQLRDLQSHLRDCSSCSALAESNLALKSVRPVAPVPGFAARFQVRLAENRRASRLRQTIGTLVLVIGGLSLLYWMINPYLMEILRSPAEWITNVVGYFLFIFAMVRVWSEISVILFGVLPDVIPPLGWLVLVSVVGGLSLMWTFSFWRFSRMTQGV